MSCSADVQGDVKGPQQSQQLHQQVDDEPAVVPFPHTVLDPRAVVVEASHAAVTRLAVLGSHRLLLDQREREKMKINQSVSTFIDCLSCKVAIHGA